MCHDIIVSARLNTKCSLLGYQVDNSCISDCVASIESTISVHQFDSSARCGLLACLNPHSYVVALDNVPFSQALHSADWLIPDGVGVVLASRLLGGSIPERVAGNDIFEGVSRRLNERGGMSVFFLGATSETLRLIENKLAQDYPNIRVAGTYSPPYRDEFTSEDNEEMLTTINAAKPDVLWVGMSSPKQDIWLHANRDHLKVGFAAAIGAVFDFYAGNVKRPNPFFRKIGLEWFGRFFQEPRRLWRRSFVNAPIFVSHVMRAYLRRLAG